MIKFSYISNIISALWNKKKKLLRDFVKNSPYITNPIKNRDLWFQLLLRLLSLMGAISTFIVICEIEMTIYVRSSGCFPIMTYSLFFGIGFILLWLFFFFHFRLIPVFIKQSNKTYLALIVMSLVIYYAWKNFYEEEFQLIDNFFESATKRVYESRSINVDD